MIEKSRLEELIKQGATIYTSRFKKPEKYKLYKDYFVAKDELVACNKSQTAIDCVIELSKLFETREEAEWALKYQHIPRTEWLDLPMFEEIEDDYILEFGKSLFEVHKTNNKIFVLTNKNYLDLYDYVFEEQATEENYEKACDLCVKLFKGESDESVCNKK